MERRPKERLIGAGILVALAVIVVPELLSGPKPEVARPEATVELPGPASAPDPVRNVTMDLTTSKALAPAAQAAAPPPAAASPAPAPTVSPSSDPEARGAAPSDTPGPAMVAPAAPPSSQQSAAAPPKSGGGFAAQLGTFASRSNAENLLHQVKAQGFAAYMSSEGSGKAARYRVRVGQLNDRDAAERTIAKLKVSGHAATLVAPR